MPTIASVEPANFFSDLDITLPASTDVILQADDHLRLLKRVLKDVFPGASLSGFNEPITATETEISFIEGVTSNLQDQLTSLSVGQIPVGGIIPFVGAFVDIPDNYGICDGTNGTPDLTNRFVYGALNESDIDTTGGQADAEVVSHTHTQSHSHSATMGDSPAHRHRWVLNNDRGSSGGAYRPRSSNNPLSKVHTSGTSAAHGHTGSVSYTGTITGGVTATDQNLPPYVKLAYIKRLT